MSRLVFVIVVLLTIGCAASYLVKPELEHVTYVRCQLPFYSGYVDHAYTTPSGITLMLPNGTKVRYTSAVICEVIEKDLDTNHNMPIPERKKKDKPEDNNSARSN